MKAAALIVVIGLIACGDESGERLLESEVALAYQGSSFEPMYGYAQFIDRDNILDAPGHVLIGTSRFDCKFDGDGRPEAGVVATIGLPDFQAGNYDEVAIDFTRYQSGLAVDQHLVLAPVTVTEADSDVVSLDLSFAETVDGESYSLTGRVTAMRCN